MNIKRNKMVLLFFFGIFKDCRIYIFKNLKGWKKYIYIIWRLIMTMNNKNESNELSPNSNFFEKNSLIIFFVLSFLITIISVAIIYFGTVVIIDTLFFYISIWSPTISAIIIAGIIGGWSEIKQLLSGFLKWKRL